MIAASGERRLARWLHGALAVWMVLGTLATTAPFSPTYAEPVEQGSGRGQPQSGGERTNDQAAAGRQSDQICRRSTSPLNRTYVDTINSFAFQYPQDWFWRPRSDGLPGTRSDTVWFAPVVDAGSLPNCI